MNKRFLSILVCALMLSAIAAGCSNQGDNSGGGDSAAAGPLDAITVSGGGEDSMGANPQDTGTLLGLSICRHLYEGLYKLDESGTVVLGQAASVDTSDDGLTYTFTLRDDIKWSDGQAVTAADFVYGWKYLVDKGSDYAGLLSMIASADAPDDKTVVVNLAYPCSYFDAVLAFPPAYPAREDKVAEFGDAYATDPETSVYNGAYTMASWSHQQSLVMEKNENYYNSDAITVSKITWAEISDSAAMLNSFKTGELVYADSYPEEEAENLIGAGLHYAPGYSSYCTLFNVGPKGPEALKDVRVRKALTLAIDRTRIVDDIRKAGDEIADTYTPSGLTNDVGVEFNSTVTKWYDVNNYEANKAEAQQLLADAGYPNGQGFPVMNYIVNNAARKTVAEAVVDDWKTVLGIDTITVEIVETFFNTRNEQDYDIAYFGWFMDYVDVSNMLYTCTTGVSDSGYSSAEYDAAYNAATAAVGQEAQWENYKKCEELLAADLPLAPILHQQNSYLLDDTKYTGLVYYCGNFYFGYLTAL